MTLEKFGWRPDSRAAEAFAPLAAAGARVGRVVLQQRDRYQVYTELGELDGVVAGQLRHQAEAALSLPAVGDWVALDYHGPESPVTLQQVLPRQSQFVRQAAGTVTAAQVVAANVDTVFLMAGLDGDLNLRRLERYLVTAWDSGASPVVVLNKADLCADLAAAIAAVAGVAIGVPIHPISVVTGMGLEQLRPYLAPGQTIALIGSSGVGKSTLTNLLLGTEQQATQAVRADDSRGRHTTTHRQLIPLPAGALLIDTPGMRELQLWSSGSGLADTFGDVAALAATCKFRDCRHGAEPGCAVQAAIAAGGLSPQRLHSYQKLQREQQWSEQRQNTQARLNTKRRWKQVTKTLRHHPKYR